MNSTKMHIEDVSNAIAIEDLISSALQGGLMDILKSDSPAKWTQLTGTWFALNTVVEVCANDVLHRFPAD